MRIKRYTVCQHAGRFHWVFKKPGQPRHLVEYWLFYDSTKRVFFAHRYERLTANGEWMGRTFVTATQTAILRSMLRPSDLAACAAASIQGEPDA